MSHTRFVLRFLFVLLVSLLALSACDRGSEEDSVPPVVSGEPDPGTPTDPAIPAEDASLRLKLATYALGTTGSGAQAQAVAPLAARKAVTGYLLAVPQDNGGGQSKLFSFGIEIDEGSFQLQTPFNPPLPAGTYDFYFLLVTDTDRYGGRIVNQMILSGQNNLITLTLHPIVGNPINDPGDLIHLSVFRLVYDPSLLLGFKDPRLGIRVDNGEERVYAINREQIEEANRADRLDPESGFSRIYANLSGGAHVVELRYYDGSRMVAVSVDDDEKVQASTGPGDSENDLPQIGQTLLTAGPTYTFTPTASPDDDPNLGTAQFHFTLPGAIPAEVIDEVGGLDNLLGVFTLVGAHNAVKTWQFDALALTPRPGTEGTTYELDLYLPGVLGEPPFYAEPVTWSLNLYDRSAGDSLVAYCAKAEVADTSASGRSFLCHLNLWARQVPTTDPLIYVDISVHDALGTGVPGAVVSLRMVSETGFHPVGITGDGNNGTTPGRLRIFLPQSADYQVQVTYPPTGQQSQPQSPPGQPGSVDLVIDDLTVTGPRDVIPPGSVTGLVAEAGPQRVVLTWTDPADSDLAGVMIRRSHTGYPADKTQGELVVDAEPGAGSFVDSVVEAGLTYYYSAFAYDAGGNFAPAGEGAHATAIPYAVTDPPEKPSLDAIEVTATRRFRPRTYENAPQTLTWSGWFRIPSAVSVSQGQGNPEHYVFTLSLGRVKCFYVGGRWKTLLAEEWEEVFEHFFKSPACIGGPYQAGDLVFSDGPITARVITGDPHYDATTVKATIEVDSWVAPLKR